MTNHIQHINGSVLGYCISSVCQSYISLALRHQLVTDNLTLMGKLCNLCEIQCEIYSKSRKQSVLTLFLASSLTIMMADLGMASLRLVMALKILGM